MGTVTILPTSLNVTLMEEIVVYQTKQWNIVKFAYVTRTIPKVIEYGGSLQSLLNKASFTDICWQHKLIGNQFCDAMTNNELCNYDGGDCCLTIVDYRCEGDECICHEDGLVHPTYQEGKISFLL